MPDPVENLTTAWIEWEAAPTSRPKVIAKLDAIRALGLDSNETHNHMAQWRRQDYSVPDAVQSLVNEPRQEAA